MHWWSRRSREDLTSTRLVAWPALQRGHADAHRAAVARERHDVDVHAICLAKCGGRDDVCRRTQMREDTHLVTEVETRRRLVHDEDRRLLRERTGHQCQLTLAAAHLGIRPVG